MAQEVSEDLKISLNSQYYNLKFHPLARYLSKQTAKVNFGDDSYSKLNISNWIISDNRGGLGISEMDESVHVDRYWWGNCITDWRGHIYLPRQVKSVTAPNGIATAASLANKDMELDSDWINGNRSSVQKYEGTYSWTLISETVFQDATTWDNSWRSRLFVFAGWIYTTTGSNTRIQINDGVGTSSSAYHTGAAGWEWFTVSRTLDASATRLRVQCESGGTTSYFDLCTISSPVTGTAFKFANFNSKLYTASGSILGKLNAGRTAIDVVYSFPATITKIINSLNTRLYIYLGDSDNYWVMDTAEAFTETNVNDATRGIQWDDKLWKMDADGNWWYSTNPESATPTWTSQNGITDIASQIETLFIGPDADGNDIIYCATHTFLKAFDFTNNKWVDTKVKLPDHPNGGEGAAYWQGAIYLSYGLGVKKYITGSTATISETGLLRDDGLPVEYNGEIVKLLGEAASDDMFALVDASQASGNSKSGLYAYNGRGWKCWWADSNNNGAMNDCIVSSASSGYAIYWDVGGAIKYIDIHRGISNPEQLVGVQNYEAAGIHISPWFDAGTPVFDKLLALLTSYAKKITTTETIAIKYRTDKAYTDLDTGWATIETLNTTGENDENEEIFASGAGLAFNSIQYRLDLARGSTTTLSPDLQSLVSSFELLTGADGNWVWTLTIPLDYEHGTSPKQKKKTLDTAVQLGTLVPLKFRDSASDEPHYVRLSLINAWYQTGRDYEGEYTIMAVKL